MNRIIAIALLGTALAACSDNAMENPDSGRLETKADVLREIGQFGRFLDVAAPLYGEAPAQGSPAFYSGRRATPSLDCDGGTATATEGAAPTQFDYFNTSETADFVIYRYANCERADSSDSEVDYLQDGVFELGELRGKDPLDLFSSFYSYAEYGDATADYAYERRISDTAGNVVEQVLEQVRGRIERASDDTGSSTGSVITRVITRVVPDGYTLSWQQGKNSAPLYGRYALGGDPDTAQYSVRGPISYNSSLCEGGTRSIEIPEPGVDVAGDTPVGGSLSLSLAGSTVTLTFDGEGADITFANGGNARITRAEIEAAMSDPQC